jgi:hypothetical protein
MKAGKIFAFTVSILMVCTSCSRYTYKNYTSGAYIIPEEAKYIELDERYQLYYRAVMTDVQQTEDNMERQKVLNLHSGGVAANGKGIVGGKIVEIEYLFISPDTGIIIYISTVADRYQKRYSTDDFLGLNRPNAADFRVFLIGKIRNGIHDQFTFYAKDGKHTDNWLVNYNADQITLIENTQKRFSTVELVIPFGQAMAHPLTFTRTNDWKLTYFNSMSAGSTGPERFDIHRIYYLKFGKKATIVLPFEKTTLVFKDKYVIYDPDKAVKLR